MATKTETLQHIQRWYPLFVGAIFIFVAISCSIWSSGTVEDEIAPTVRGPSRNLLPSTRRRTKQNAHRPNMFDLSEIRSSAKLTFQLLSTVLTGTLFLNAIVIGTHAWRDNPDLFDRKGEINWWCGEPMVYVVGSACVYLYLAVTLFDWEGSPRAPHILTWCLAFLAEGTIFLCSFLRAAGYGTLRFATSDNVIGSDLDGWEKIDLALSLVQVAILFGLCSLYACMWSPGRRDESPKVEFSGHATLQRSADPSAKESTPLLGTHGENSNHGRSLGAAMAGEPSSEQVAFYRPEKLPKRSWVEYLKGYSLFWPYLWPRDSNWLKFRALICFLLLAAQRCVNLLLPYQIGKMADGLAGTGPDGDVAGLRSVAFRGSLSAFLMLVQGLLGSIRSIIWVKVSQYSYKALQTAAFQHVHSLSLDFHQSKRTGEVLSALNKGAAINTFLEQVTFQLLPMIVDLLLAVYFFNRVFSATYAVIISVNTFWYLYLTIKMAQTRADQRREMTNADREEEAVKNDSITSYETVKYFNAEEHEFRRYEGVIDRFQEAEARVSYGTNVMSIAQTAVYVSGLAVALTVCAFQVWKGLRSVGELTTLLMYLQQMQQPLSFFSQFYRVIQQALISGERLLELFKIQPDVQDSDMAVPLATCDGHIRWKRVTFAYGPAQPPALRDVDFECAPGTTTAFVGESGSGKSTVFRLMFRYYNCNAGKIALDGQDVEKLTIDSVRRWIGIVPQDTILFNETLMYNLKYARPGCSDEDVYEACRAASIHDKIMAFPKQYDTKVGERGLRLSGGEKQRVAIARTILKNPKVIMLDEATSALDSTTEQKIQKSVSNVGKGRTVLIIAHRLSTITHADQIIVLNQGEVVERGTHDKLLEMDGLYKSMWEKQASAAITRPTA